MAKRSARRNGGRQTSTNSQKRRRKRLQHFNSAPSLAHRKDIQGWEDKLSLKQNYRNLGIAFDANAILSTPNEAAADPIHQLVPEKTGILTARLEYLQSLPPPPPHEVKSMNVQEQYQLQRLIQRHATDYDAMQADTKLNVQQMTATKLQKRIELMFRLQQMTNTPTISSAKGNGDDEQDHDDDEDASDMNDDDDDELDDDKIESLVPHPDTTGMDEDEIRKVLRIRQKTIQRLKQTKANQTLNKRYRGKAAPSIVVPRLSKLIGTRRSTLKTISPLMADDVKDDE